jgi:hypothetical protein
MARRPTADPFHVEIRGSATPAVRAIQRLVHFGAGPDWPEQPRAVIEVDYDGCLQNRDVGSRPAPWRVR